MEAQMKTKCVLVMALMLAACDTPSMAPREGAPESVLEASVATGQLTGVVEWRVFFTRVDDATRRLIVYGVDSDGNGVAEMQLAIDPRTVEATLMKNGAWGDRLVWDFTASAITARPDDVRLTTRLWTAFHDHLAAGGARPPPGTPNP